MFQNFRDSGVQYWGGCFFLGGLRFRKGDVYSEHVLIFKKLFCCMSLIFACGIHDLFGNITSIPQKVIYFNCWIVDEIQYLHINKTVHFNVRLNNDWTQRNVSDSGWAVRILGFDGKDWKMGIHDLFETSLQYHKSYIF